MLSPCGKHLYYHGDVDEEKPYIFTLTNGMGRARFIQSIYLVIRTSHVNEKIYSLSKVAILGSEDELEWLSVLLNGRK